MTDQDFGGDDHPFDIDALFRQCIISTEIEKDVNRADAMLRLYAEETRARAHGALEQLIQVDPSEQHKIAKLQSTVFAYVTLCEWVSEQLQLGQEAADQITQNQPDLDVAPTFASRDQKEEHHDEYDD